MSKMLLQRESIEGYLNEIEKITIEYTKTHSI